MTLEIKDLDLFRDVIISAFRYDIHRHTYAFKETMDFLLNLSPNEQLGILNDRVCVVLLADIESRLDDEDLLDFERVDLLHFKDFIIDIHFNKG